MNGDRDVWVRLLQDHAVEAERLTHVFADRQHMHPTDLSALLAVMRADRAGTPLTPGRLGRRLGLSSGATTAVIDRLGRAGHVRRVPDEQDRRRVTLHYAAAADRVATEFFGPLAVRMDALLAGFDATELAAARRFLTEATQMLRDYRRSVTEAPAG